MSDEHDYKTFRFIQGVFTSTPFLTERTRTEAAEAALLQNPAIPVVLYESTAVLVPRVDQHQLWNYYPPGPIAAPPAIVAENADPEPEQFAVPDPETIVIL